MSLYNLDALAADLPEAWRSRVIARIGEANLKVARMDSLPLDAETHPYAEGLLVIDGQLNLQLAGQPLTVRRGELYVVPAGLPHAVAAGSSGTLLIVDI
jgi:quercetin dioxygenase-like cupin family protein